MQEAIKKNFFFRRSEVKIYVGNLNYDTTEDTLKSTFEKYGSVEEVNILERRGFGFVTMNNDDEARAAIDGLNDTDLDGRNIKVSEARPKRRRYNNRARYY